VSFIKAAGIPTVIAVFGFHVFNILALVYSNIWLSEWTNQVVERNGTALPRAQKDRNLAVYAIILIGQSGC
jgi:hypothetical protein